MAAHRAVGGAPEAIDWPVWHDDLPGNVLGCAHAFTAFAPMPWWKGLLLEGKFALLRIWPKTHLRRHHFVYFGRWTIVPAPRGAGGWRDRYVLIETNYNGSFSEYLDTLAVDLWKNLRAVWGPCYECPPNMQPPSAFRNWARKHELPAEHFFCAYPDLTVKQIEIALIEERTGSRARAEKAIREPPRPSLLDRLRDLPQRLLRPNRAAPVGAHPAVRRKGPVSAMTFLTPIRPDKLEALRKRLGDIEEARGRGEASPFEEVPGTHVARWVVVDQLVNEKMSDGPLDLDPPRLLFGAVGDGTPAGYLDTLCEHLPPYAREVWTEHCEGGEAAPLKGYLHDNRLRGGLLFAGYRARVDEVRNAVRRAAEIQ